MIFDDFGWNNTEDFDLHQQIADWILSQDGSSGCESFPPWRDGSNLTAWGFSLIVLQRIRRPRVVVCCILLSCCDLL